MDLIGPPDRVYVIGANTNLFNGLPLLTHTPPGTPFEFVDPESSHLPHLFYRASETPKRFQRTVFFELFADGRRRGAEERSAEESALFEQIGRLQMEVAWLKKKSAELA